MVKPYVEDIEGLKLSDMDEEFFNDYLELKIKKHNDKIAEEKAIEVARLAKIEAEKIHQARKESILPYWEFVPQENKEDDFSKLTNNEWIERFNFSKTEKENKDESIRLQQIEIKKLKKEAEEKEALRLKEEKERLEKEKLEAEKREKEEAKKQAILDKEKAKQDAILKNEREAKAKLESELKAKLEAEEKEAELKLQLEEEARLKADQLAKAPIKEKYTLWVNNFEIPLPQEPNEVTLEIAKKFNSFKKWALSEVEKY